MSSWPRTGIETGGSSKVAWLIEPQTGDLWLHKDVHVPTDKPPQGEDWAEVAATQVATLLGIPCATTRLCEREGIRGSLSLSVTPEGYDLNNGGVVLEAAMVPGYFRHSETEKGFDPDRPDVKRPGYTLENIRKALDGVVPPHGFQGPSGCTGFDIFAGYAVLDALVANPDRHEDNWAVLVPRLERSPMELAPSFDHGGALGHQLLDGRREQLINNENALLRWASKGMAQRFEHVGKPSTTLVEHAAAAASMCSDPAVQWWKERLRSIDLESLQETLTATRVSGMSVATVTFISQLLSLNLRRLRDAIRNTS